MLIIGLTGGLGSGKSTVARYFQELGVPVIDADTIARELVAPGDPALAEIVAAFGPEVLTRSGALDRARLRRLVFDEPVQRHRLEAILHPRIRREMERRVAQLADPYCILVIPLLLEAKQTDLVHRILVVDAPQALQVRRVQARDDLTEAEINGILAAQLTRRERLARAHDVIVNDGDLDHLQRLVAALHARYLDIATTD